MRFALLFHRVPPADPRSDHYDLLLEIPGTLLSWELSVKPFQQDGTTIGRQLPNHRLLYLDYQGPLTGNRGQVEQVFVGELQWQTQPAADTSPLQAVVTVHETDWLLQLSTESQAGNSWLVEWRRLG